MPIRVSGSNWGCSITSRRSCIGLDREIVRYDVLANWWAEVVKGTPVRLYAGVALYKVGTPAASEPAWAIDGGVPELKRQLDLNEPAGDGEPSCSGSVI